MVDTSCVILRFCDSFKRLKFFPFNFEHQIIKFFQSILACRKQPCDLSYLKLHKVSIIVGFLNQKVCLFFGISDSLGLLN